MDFCSHAIFQKWSDLLTEQGVNEVNAIKFLQKRVNACQKLFQKI